jgi:hypothetical protein
MYQPTIPNLCTLIDPARQCLITPKENNMGYDNWPYAPVARENCWEREVRELREVNRVMMQALERIANAPDDQCYAAGGIARAAIAKVASIR